MTALATADFRQEKADHMPQTRFRINRLQNRLALQSLGEHGASHQVGDLAGILHLREVFQEMFQGEGRQGFRTIRFPES